MKETKESRVMETCSKLHENRILESVLEKQKLADIKDYNMLIELVYPFSIYNLSDVYLIVHWNTLRWH